MKIKKAGLLTKVVVLVLLIGLVITLLDMRGQIADLEAQKAQRQEQVSEQTQTNADLQDAVEHSDELDRQMDIARSELGLVAPGEKVFHFPD